MGRKLILKDRVGISKNHPQPPHSGESYGSVVKWLLLSEGSCYCSETLSTSGFLLAMKSEPFQDRHYRRNRGFHLIVTGEPKET